MRQYYINQYLTNLINAVDFEKLNFYETFKYLQNNKNNLEIITVFTFYKAFKYDIGLILNNSPKTFLMINDTINNVINYFDINATHLEIYNCLRSLLTNIEIIENRNEFNNKIYKHLTTLDDFRKVAKL